MSDLTISVSLDSSSIGPSANQVNSQISQIGTQAQSTANSVGSLANINFSQQIAQLRQYGESIKQVGSQISGYGQQLTVGLSLPISAVSILGIKFNATKEQALIAFGVLLKSGEKAKQLFTDLSKFAANTPFEMPELQTATKSLLAYGFAQEQIVPNLTMLGDIASGLTIPLSELSAIYGKMKIGKLVQTDDLNQLTDRGIPVIQEFAKQLGVSEDKVKDMASQGKITFPMLEKAFQDLTKEGGLFSGMMAAQSKTFSGQMSTLSDAANTSLGKITEPLFNFITANLPLIISTVEQLSAAFDALSPSVKNTIFGILAFAAAVGPILVVVGSVISFVGSLVGAVATMLPVFAAIGGAILAVSGFIGPFIGLIGSAGLVASFSALASVVSAAAAPAITAFLAALVPIAAGVAVVVAVIGVMIGIGVALYAAYQTNFGGLKDLVTAVFQDIVSTIQGGLQAIQDFWTTYGATIIASAMDIFNRIVDFIQPIMTEIVSTVREAISTIIEVAGPLMAQISTLVKTKLAQIFETVKVILAAISSFWSQHGEQIKSIVSAVWTILKTIVMTGIRQIANVITLVLAIINGDWSAAWTAFKQIVQTGINAAITILKSLGTLIVSALAFVATKLYNIGKDIVQGLINGIKSGAAAVYNAVAEIASNVVGKLKNIFATQSPSRVTFEIGEFVGEGLALGIESKESRVVNAAQKVAAAAIKQFKDAQIEFSKLAGASPNTVKTIQQANTTADATSAQQEIIKLRGELNVDNDLPLPDEIFATLNYLKYLQDKKKVIEETKSPLEQLQAVEKQMDEDRAKQIENFNKLTESITLNGEARLLQSQKEFNLLGVTDEVEKQRIENAYELLKLREQLNNDGYGEDQITEAVELLRIENARVLEWTRLKQLKQQQIDIDKKIKEDELKAADEAAKQYENKVSELAGSLSRIFGAGAKDGFKGFLKQSLEELKNFGKKLLDDILGSLAQSFSKFILGKISGNGSGGGFGGIFDSIKKIFGGGSASGGSSGGGFGDIFNSIKKLFGGGGSASGSGALGGLRTGNLPGAPGSPNPGGGIGLAGGVAIAGMGANLIGGLIGGRVGGFISGAGSGAALGAQIGSLFGPGPGTAIGAVVGAIGGGLLSLLGGDPKRKKDAKENIPALNKGFAETFAQMTEILKKLQTRPRPSIAPDEAIAQATESVNQIKSGFGIKFESPKYQKESQKMIAAKSAEADAILKQITQQAAIARTIFENQASVKSKLIAEFSTGTYVGRRVMDDQMRDMRSMQFERRVGVLSGQFTGKDYLPSYLADGEMVLNPKLINNVILNAGFDPFKNAGIPGYADGTYIQPSAPTVTAPSVQNSSAQNNTIVIENITIELEANGLTEAKVKNISIDSLNSDKGQRVLAKNIKILQKERESN